MPAPAAHRRASLTWADIDATAAYAHGQDAARWLRTRPGRSGLVVWSDGSTTLVDGPAPITA
jgi:thiamine biosynthesis lipoprotein